MTIRFACKCGQFLVAQEAHVGARVKCGVCGEVSTVPADASAVPATPRAAVPQTPVRPSRSRIPWSLVVLGLILLVVGGGIGGYFYWRSSENIQSADEQTLIPADGTAFLSMRVADTWNKPAGQEYQQYLQREHPSFVRDMDTNWGLTPEQIERFTVVWPTAEEDFRYTIIATIQPYDKRKVLDALCAGGSDTTYLDKKYRVERNSRVAVYPASATVIVTGSERAVKRCIEMQGKPKQEGALQAGIKLLDDPQYQIVGATGSKLPPLGTVTTPELFGPDSGMQGSTLTGKVDQGMDSTAVITFSDAEKAEAARRKVLPTKTLFWLAAPDEVKPTLDKLQARTEGSNLLLTTKLDAKQTAALLAFLSRDLPRGPGSK